jgi:hypothetical protein
MVKYLTIVMKKPLAKVHVAADLSSLYQQKQQRCGGIRRCSRIHQVLL